jgi:pyruvate/2-oxoglutarate dehydrogenase complex dihydrolipoamide dehydrogenase (E3) component
MTHVDAIIIGAGQAGPPLAGRLTDAGQSVVLVERALFGGTCVNTGCTPTKTLVASAYAAHLARRASDYGVVIDGAVRVDMKAVKARTDKVSGESRKGVEDWLRGMERCTVVQGHAHFEGPHIVRVGDDSYTAPRIFINVGGRARTPDLPGVQDVPVLNNTSMLALDEVPRHLVVVGGSYIGLEFAQMYRRFGADVTIVEMGPRLIGREDEEISAAIKGIIEAEGITVRTGAACISLARHEEGIAVQLDCQKGPPVAVGSHVLFAVGRVPNTDDLGLDRAGVVMDDRGYITVDDTLQTNVPGIWAIGDCNGRGAFTHTSYNDFEIVAANLLDGATRSVAQRTPAYALYIDPPLGRVGMTESEARRSGRKVLVARRPMSRVSRAIEKGETQGLMKIVADADTGKILGAAILGVGGDEAVHGVIDMMQADVTYDVLQRAVPIHPTVSELIPTVIGDLKPA